MSAVILAVATSSAVISSAVAQDGGPPDPTQFEWKGQIEPGSTVRVHQPHGDLRCRFGGYSHELELIGTIQNLQPKGPQLAVTVHPGKTVTEVTVGYPPGTVAAAEVHNRVDLVVYLPEGVRLEATTHAGLIEAKGLKSDIELRSEKADIRVRSGEGNLGLSTNRGVIDLVLDPGRWDRPIRLESVQGDISVHFADGTAAAVEAETSGEISTDYSIDIEHRPLIEPGKRATMTLGSGGERVEIANKRGRIRLLRLQKNFASEEPAKGESAKDEH